MAPTCEQIAPDTWISSYSGRRSPSDVSPRHTPDPRPLPFEWAATRGRNARYTANNADCDARDTATNATFSDALSLLQERSPSLFSLPLTCSLTHGSALLSPRIILFSNFCRKRHKRGGFFQYKFCLNLQDKPRSFPPRLNEWPPGVSPQTSEKHEAKFVLL
jgi:hypothetical protein